ncbi:type II secretion system protein [Candidatus Uabimicrobium amorphum]|uniref:Prepilin-type N-terminal cleavage/methylation domain-containing protein n=1 Tax=Uabimicrobium amorphum TaxID=2596890 RepID=A0A5S9F3D8_UABAM|nr:type II secretion system protein [Candidatus Uabimicrobium amorphum]BBM84151.1 hypothetical protein UABAM_02507 [Candidatus Uabimicrobium amorphum]
MHTKKYGFTITELLVVLCIFSILLSVVYSSFQEIRKQALTISCRVNMYQLSKGFLLYSLDYGGFLPHSDRDSDTGKNYCWFDVLDEYLNVRNLQSVKQCPQWSGAGEGETTDEHSIKMNGALCNRERRNGKNGENGKWYWPQTWYIKDKSKTVLLVDGTMIPPLNRHTDTRIHEPHKDISMRHNGTNLLFIDGSCAFVLPTPDGNSIPHDKFVWEPYRK